jgi:Protein of unknown function (DUF3014)
MQKNTIWYVAAGVLVLLSAVALYVSWRANHRAAAPTALNTPTAPIPPSTGIANPVPVPSGLTTAPLPTLEDSDKPLHDSLSELFSAKSVGELLRPDMIVRHIVVTVDNLPRKHAAIEMRPTKNVAGTFAVKGDEQSATIDPANYQRYAPYVHLLQSLNTEQFATTYFHYYPLFQQSYEGLGYPNAYFNDRLVAAIDDALAAPDVRGPVALMRPNVMYQYSDPKIESLSAGQRLMVRLGPDNEAAVKAKLQELRAAVASHKAD